MFDALVNGRIDPEGLSFDVQLADIETLNSMALDDRLDITKMSAYAYGLAMDRYRLLSSGSALGYGCGPLLISKHPLSREEIQQGPIAIPGEKTTAHFLLRYFLGSDLQTTAYRFSDIEGALLREEVRAGVIIHENRFTYAQKGLRLVQDLGAYWESTTGLPIPLGVIAVSRCLELAQAEQINRLIRASVRHAMAHPEASREYVRSHAQELDDAIIQQHIALYVNHFSLDFVPVGFSAIERFLREAVGRPIDVHSCLVSNGRTA